MKKWQKIVLIIAGAYIAYSIIMYAILSFCKKNYGKFGINVKTVIALTQFYRYSLFGFLGIYP